MGKYDDTTDMAYSGDLASVAIPERRLFEEPSPWRVSRLSFVIVRD